MGTPVLYAIDCLSNRLKQQNCALRPSQANFVLHYTCSCVLQSLGCPSNSVCVASPCFESCCLGEACKGGLPLHRAPGHLTVFRQPDRLQQNESPGCGGPKSSCMGRPPRSEAHLLSGWLRLPAILGRVAICWWNVGHFSSRQGQSAESPKR